MHSFEEYNKPIQELISFMQDDYPNGYILEINAFSAELKNNITCATYLDDETQKILNS